MGKLLKIICIVNSIFYFIGAGVSIIALYKTDNPVFGVWSTCMLIVAMKFIDWYEIEKEKESK